MSEMEFWKEHVALRLGLMLLTFLTGLIAIYKGWCMTGQMTGLLIMLAGLGLLLLCLALYNKPFQEPKHRK